uniref:Uncharacterized protein n=1 Tax=Cacopsylla melanoneura TaxID=428564 RepID=A0A8D8LLX8_9HEMI
MSSISVCFLSILLQHHISKASILFLSLSLIVHDSEPYNATLQTKLLISCFLILGLTLFEHRRVFFLLKAIFAKAILCFISLVHLASSVILLPRYLKVFICLIFSLLILMLTSSLSFAQTNISVFFIFIFILYFSKTSFIVSKDLFRLNSSGANTAISSANLNICTLLPLNITPVQHSLLSLIAFSM